MTMARPHLPQRSGEGELRTAEEHARMSCLTKIDRRHRDPVKREDDPEDDGGGVALSVGDSIMDESDGEEEEVGGMLDGEEDDD